MLILLFGTQKTLNKLRFANYLLKMISKTIQIILDWN